MNRGGRGGNQQQQQQKMQTDLRDANKATRVRLAVPADPVRERHEAQAKTLNALMLVVAFVAALLALVFDVALLVWFAAICTVVRSRRFSIDLFFSLS